MAGAFGLVSPQDLLAKLGRDLERLRRCPDDIDQAFNFFVNAEHMPDWLHPGRANEKIRRAARDSEPLLQLVSQIANGAKHFDELSKHHQSVRAYSGSVWEPGVWAAGTWGTLSVVLSDQFARRFGAHPSAIELAERTYAYWSEPRRVT